MPDELHLLGPVRRAYDADINSGKIDIDPAQTDLVAVLDLLMEDLSAIRLSSKSSALGWLFGKSSEQKPNRNGLYIWGGVGRGKSYLMDLFYEVATISPKRRVHFNDFMQEAHQHIHNHRQIFKAGKTKQKDPIKAVGKRLAAKSKLLCFDEFSVSDITDAMLLGRLFTVLFDEGVVIVATSNIMPRDLYKDGLNRQLFLPFIELLEKKVQIRELSSANDYRLAKLPNKDFYTWPLNERARIAMNKTWNVLTDNAIPQKFTLNLKKREWEINRTAKSIVRFSFDELCRNPRGVADYLAVAEHFSTILIENVPIILASERNEAKRFINLIDVLYDNQCRLIVSADGPPAALYQAKSGREAFEFERTQSRLIEMQSTEYNNRITSTD